MGQLARTGSDAVSALPEPFYCADGVTIYNADCRPILATLDPARVLVIADPPYGIGERTDRATSGRASTAHGTLNGGAKKGRDFPPVAGDDQPFDPEHLLRFRVVLFGANHYAARLPVSPSWIVWDKREGGTSDDNADCEIAWSNLGGPARLFSHKWRGLVRASENTSSREHPTQKPVALAKWIISRYARPGDTIVEPYMGAGFATVAAHQLGYPSLACDLVEDYCKVVVRRVSQRVLDFGAVTVATP